MYKNLFNDFLHYILYNEEDGISLYEAAFFYFCYFL